MKRETVLIAQERTVVLNYDVTLPEIGSDAGDVEVWMPLPLQTPHQEVLALQIESTLGYSIAHDPVHGNAILHARGGDGVASARIAYRAAVRRREWKVRFEQALPHPIVPDASTMAIHLSENKKIRFLPEIREVAARIRSEQSGPLEIARAAYDHVLSTMKYDKSGEGWGQGDTSYACSLGKGNCTDFHSLYLAILRAAGVPGQFEIGAAFPSGAQSGDITFFKCGYHCWASFHVPEYGWVPADVSEAAQKPELRDYYFGALDADRVVLSRGRDIDLVPKQRGEAENFFTEPRIETESGRSLVYQKKLEFSTLQ